MKIFAVFVILFLFSSFGNCQDSKHKSSRDSIIKLNVYAKAIDNLRSHKPVEGNNEPNQRTAFSNSLALLALLTSLASVFISYYTFRLQRTHDIKSVKPFLHVGQWDYENVLCVTLKNCGAGIAIVKKYTVHSISTKETRSNLYAWLPCKLEANVNYSKYFTPDREFVIQPAELVDLIKIPIDDSKPDRYRVDASIRMLEIAKESFPAVDFILQDMRLLHLSKKFDLLIAWHSFFHLPHQDQPAIFEHYTQVN